MFPDFSDLADGVSSEMRNAWEGEIINRARYRRYFDGSIFKEKVPSVVPNDEEAPELYPVGVNLARMLCLAQADALWGEWEESIVSLEPRQDTEVRESHKDASELVRQILSSSNANSMLWEVGLDGNIFGGSAIKIAPVPALPGHILWSKVPIDSFFPVWDPEDEDDFLEVYVTIPMTRDQARIKYHIDSDKDIVWRVEHWTRHYYENRVDGKRIDNFSGQNPWGVVPFAYAPRMRTTHWWGDSLVEEVARVHDELNMRLADLGEAINYNAHPVRYGINLPRSFSTKNYPIGPNVLWDLGRTIGQSPAPEVGILEAKNPIPQGTFEYINFLYDWGRTASFTPAVALGEDTGGGQRSGITVELRMTSLVRAIRRHRAYMETFLKRAIKISGIILAQSQYSDTPKRALKHLIDGDLAIHYAPIMPRDQAAIVDEVVKLNATNPPHISLETAVKKLGYGTSEVERIKAMLDDDELYPRQEKMAQAKLDAQIENRPAGMNSGTGNAPN